MGPASAVNKSLMTGSAGAMLEGTAWVDDKFVVSAIDDVTVWFDRGDGDVDGVEARLLTGRCARNRCR